jgi:hypothetical protein
MLGDESSEAKLPTPVATPPGNLEHHHAAALRITKRDRRLHWVTQPTDSSTPSLIQPPRQRPKNFTPATNSGRTETKPERVDGPARFRPHPHAQDPKPLTSPSAATCPNDRRGRGARAAVGRPEGAIERAGARIDSVYRADSINRF